MSHVILKYVKCYVVVYLYMHRMAQPAIRSYDKMFEVEEEERLSGERGGEGEGPSSNHHLLGAPGAPTP